MPGHQIPLATFVRTSQQTEAVLRGLTKELFGDDVQFELHVLPPEDGSFLNRLGVVILAAGAVLWGFVESDIGKAFIKGLTDYEPAQIAETLGKTLKAGLKELLTEGNDVELEIDKIQPASDTALETLIICEMAKSFLVKDNADLARVGINPRKFRDAFEAKNEFYQACADTPHLRAIGFSESPDFPIQKHDFLRLQVQLPPKEEDEADYPWFVSMAVLKVTSPNWDRTDKARQWKGRDHQGRERYFRIEDEEFWLRAGTDRISAHIIDTIEVQWAYQGTPEHPGNCKVLRVLRFNGDILSQAIPDDEIDLKFRYPPKSIDNQHDLFRDQS